MSEQAKPRTMSAGTENRERALVEKSQQPMGVIAMHFIRELDAERAAHAETLADVDRVTALAGQAQVDYLNARAVSDALLKEMERVRACVLSKNMTDELRVELVLSHIDHALAASRGAK